MGSTMEYDQSHKIVVVTDIIHRFEMPGTPQPQLHFYKIKLLGKMSNKVALM